MARAKLSPAFDEATGRYGAVMVARGRTGTQLRARPRPKRRATPDQLANEARLRAAAGMWNGLTDAQYAAWNAYAGTLTRRSAGGFRSYTPIGYNTFLSLTLVRLQVAPGSPVPLWPPVGGFGGDDVEFAAAAAEGGIVFEALGANRPGVVTELMVQRLAHRRRKPTPRYKGMAFVAFTEAGSTFEVPLEPGAYACATRFVEAATGRATVFQRLVSLDVG